MPAIATMDMATSLLSTAELTIRPLTLLLLASLFITSIATAAGITTDTKVASASATAAGIPADTKVASATATIAPDSQAEFAPAPPEAETDLWQRLRSGMDMPELDSPLVERQEQWFAARPAYLQTSFKRARLYLVHLVDEVEARGMPMEIALLPVVESAYNPRALSPAKASGIWQFIPSTGKVFGLKQNGWYDGRQDVVTATDAALDYLEKLHDMFGAWDLALAAYNCGEGCVGRAIARNRAKGLPTDYLSLDLPGETRNYVPRLIAVRNLVREPERYGLELAAMPNQPYFQQVNLPYPIEAKTAARMAEIDMEELLALNPGYRRHVIHADSQDNLLLPVDKLALFRANFEAADSQRIRLRSYKASKGELLTRIADRFDVTIQWLKDHNPLELKRGKIVQAQTLMLPPASARKVAATATTKKQATRTSGFRTHTIRRGDTLFALAQRYKVSVADIREFNGALKVLRPGAKIQIPS
jgi:membrane-bound lytic murein transglycosylase D